MHRHPLAAACVLLLACDRGGEAPGRAAAGGTMIIGTRADADALLPPLTLSSPGRSIVDLTFAPFAVPPEDLRIVGDAGFTPALADRWEWAGDSLSIAFHLQPSARWHDGARVTADDVRFTFGLFRAPAIGFTGADLIADIDSVSVRDSSTFVVWYRRKASTMFHDFVYNVRAMPRHVYGAIPLDSLRTSGPALHPVGSGRFRFARWEPGVRLELVADTNHWTGRPPLDRIVWTVAGDAVMMPAQLASGEIDLLEFVRAEQIPQLSRDSLVRLARRDALDFALVLFNLRNPRDSTRPHPIFSDAGTRRALSMAIDRAALVRSVVDTLGTVMKGPYLSFQRVDGVRLPPHDTSAASRLLDSLGWRDANGDGIRERRGTPLRFGILAPTTSPPRVAAAVLMQEAFRRIGARVDVEKVEFAAFRDLLLGGGFDLVVNGNSGDPIPAFIRQLYQTGAGQNFGRFSSPRFDATIDSAVAAPREADAMALYARAGQVLGDETPAIWLYELSGVTGFHRRFRPAAMRRDAWWAHLDEWSVDPAQLIDRDRIGLRAPRQ